MRPTTDCSLLSWSCDGTKDNEEEDNGSIQEEEGEVLISM